MRIHMPHVHMPHLEDRQVKGVGRSLAVFTIVMLMMIALAAIFLREPSMVQPDWLR